MIICIGVYCSEWLRWMWISFFNSLKTQKNPSKGCGIREVPTLPGGTGNLYRKPIGSRIVFESHHGFQGRAVKLLDGLGGFDTPWKFNIAPEYKPCKFSKPERLPFPSWLSGVSTRCLSSGKYPRWPPQYRHLNLRDLRATSCSQDAKDAQNHFHTAWSHQRNKCICLDLKRPDPGGVESSTRKVIFGYLCEWVLECLYNSHYKLNYDLYNVCVSLYLKCKALPWNHKAEFVKTNKVKSTSETQQCLVNMHSIKYTHKLE